MDDSEYEFCDYEYCHEDEQSTAGFEYEPPKCNKCWNHMSLVIGKESSTWLCHMLGCGLFPGVNLQSVTK